jgi:hypothetical protein
MPNLKDWLRLKRGKKEELKDYLTRTGYAHQKLSKAAKVKSSTLISGKVPKKFSSKTFVWIILLIVFVVWLINATPFSRTQQSAVDSVNKDEKAIIQKTVLSFLEERLEFCQIIKENILSNKGEFWLTCNNRPFYAAYNDGNVNIELNGWSWLKDTEYWSDLEDCDFYDSEKIDNNYNLMFYCPRDFSGELTAKVYEFDTDSIKINKIEEKDFLEVIDKDIESIYNFLGECEIKDSVSKSELGLSALPLTYTCEDGEWSITTFGAMSLLPPILMDKDLSYEERAKLSFEKSFGCNADNINSLDGFITINSICKNEEFIIRYDFSSYDVPVAFYRTDCKEPCLEFGKYFILPPIEDTENSVFIKKEMPTPEIRSLPLSIYRMGGKIILIQVADEQITTFSRKPEGLYDE